MKWNRTFAVGLLALAMISQVGAENEKKEKPTERPVVDRVADKLGISPGTASKVECGRSRFGETASWAGSISAAILCSKLVCTTVGAAEGAAFFSTLGIPTATCLLVCAVAGGLILEALADEVIPIQACASAIVRDNQGNLSWAWNHSSGEDALHAAKRRHREKHRSSSFLMGVQTTLGERCQVLLRDNDSEPHLGVGKNLTQAKRDAHRSCREISLQCSAPKTVGRFCNAWAS